MVDECSTCFYGRIRSSDGKLACKKSAPNSVGDNSAAEAQAQWLIVPPNEWCGDFSATDPAIYTHMAGPQGSQGPIGPQGPPGGSPGSQWSFGTDAPSGGSSGDWYIMQSSGEFVHGSIWQNISGTWTQVLSV